MIKYFMLDIHLVHGKSKMAKAHFSSDEVLKIIFEEVYKYKYISGVC